MFKTHFERGLTQKLVVFLLLMIGFVPIYAQKNITGKVIDEKGEPLIGATILVVGSTTGVITDFDGNFTLQVKPGDELNISSIGYATQRVKVNGKESLQIVMVEDSELLDEVVVVGYGTMKKKDLTGSVKSISNATFLFTGLWGLNHFGPGVGETLGLDVREYSKEELIAATNYYAAQATQYAGTVQRDEQGRAQFADFQTLSKQAGDGYLSLRSAYPQFDGAVDPVKSLLSWRLFSQFGTTGIFICFTGESCVNPDTYEAWVPFTMCHEIAHRQAVAAEDEANFCAYLACMENPRNDFRYSGAFAAYIYCNNALAKVDRSAAASIWQNVADGVRADAQAANEHYAQYEGKVQDAAQKVNDAYLKAFSEESGVQSYGEVADLLIAWYLQKTA